MVLKVALYPSLDSFGGFVCPFVQVDPALAKRTPKNSPSLQFEDGKVGHDIDFPVRALSGKVLLEDGDIVGVVAIDAVDERLDDFWAIRGSVGDSRHVVLRGNGGKRFGVGQATDL